MLNINNKILYCVLGCMLGPALGGFFIGKSIEKFKLSERVVVVKGLAERELKSDLAVWKINYKNSSDDLSALDAKMAADKQALEDFLIKAGFAKEDIQVVGTTVSDKNSREYSYGNDEKAPRYVVTGEILVRTSEVDMVATAQGNLSQLIHKGVIVSGSPSYYYTKLLELRPQMIAEATQNARQSAMQFAQDSGSKVGAIKSANQGAFTIAAKDTFGNDSYGTDLSSVDKKIRVVSTITFGLEK